VQRDSQGAGSVERRRRGSGWGRGGNP
jgi:hypothetical protein